MTAQTYTVTYDGNSADSGKTTDTNTYTPGTMATVKENGYTRDDYTFTGWNTKADGSGKSYAEGASIKMLSNVVLYAQWTRNSSHDNDDDKYFFAIQKVDAQDGHALNDAKFELYQLDSRGNKLAAFRKTTSRWGTESGIALSACPPRKPATAAAPGITGKSPPQRATHWTQRNMKFPQGISITMTRARRWPKPKPCGTTAAPPPTC